MSELKPCPFCGGEASIYEEIPGGYIVQCHDCCGQIGIMTREHAIAAWNARAGAHCAYAQPTDLTVGCALLAERTCEMEREEGGWSCSECGVLVLHPRLPNYCPDCGARVVEEVDA